MSFADEECATVAYANITIYKTLLARIGVYENSEISRVSRQNRVRKRCERPCLSVDDTRIKLYYTRPQNRIWTFDTVTLYGTAAGYLRVGSSNYAQRGARPICRSPRCPGKQVIRP